MGFSSVPTLAGPQADNTKENTIIVASKRYSDFFIFFLLLKYVGWGKAPLQN
jgi:hypothetical protein